MKHRLLILNGSQAGRCLELTAQPLTIGRAPNNHLHLDEVSISQHHAEIFTLAGKLLLRDFQSTNGTRVNGLQVTEAELREGDQLLLGDVKMRLESVPLALGSALRHTQP